MKIVQISQLVVAILLIISILLQSRGGGLSGVFGGSEVYSVKRGAEKIIFIATIILSVLFFGLSLAGIFII